MLYELVNTTCAGIQNLDTEIEAPKMFEQINEARPEILHQLQQAGDQGADNEPLVRLVTLAIATGVLTEIKQIPDIANFMIQKVKDSRAPTALRCAMASVLAYLVQPHDLIPDNTPGGYGFVDDRAILQAGLVELLKVQPTTGYDVQKEENRLNMFASIMPNAVLPAMQLAVQGMSTVFQILNGLPSNIAASTLEQIIANPLQAATPAAPPGFTPRAIPELGHGHWSGGAYFEGDNVTISGGPSLIDGKLFIPD